ncbi:hypothetical protein [uncultured Pseudoalteromonas sp.]|uniref:hypothetical protein n=1 Tax=uncultured Pseudoalteromonas sp. TaxID=114053 RepID=UPI002597F88D|nr:hypothetical protein [uncultured Pseudoalteromonas sp.]
MTNNSIEYTIKREDYTSKPASAYMTSEQKEMLKALVERSPPVAQLIENLIHYIGCELRVVGTQTTLLDKAIMIDGQCMLDSDMSLSADAFFSSYAYRIAETLKAVLSTVIYTKIKPDTRITWVPLKETLSSFSKRCKQLNVRVIQYTEKKDMPAESELLVKHFIMSMLINHWQLTCFGVPPLDKSRTFTFAEAFNE